MEHLKYSPNRVREVREVPGFEWVQEVTCLNQVANEKVSDGVDLWAR